MLPPVFPEKFVQQHCPKVQEARYWLKSQGDEPTDYTQFAECAFNPRGFGRECENCRLFLTRPYQGHKVDEEFLPQIEEFYRQYEIYEKWLAQHEVEIKAQQAATEFLGSGI